MKVRPWVYGSETKASKLRVWVFRVQGLGFRPQGLGSGFRFLGGLNSGTFFGSFCLGPSVIIRLLLFRVLLRSPIFGNLHLGWVDEA